MKKFKCLVLLGALGLGITLVACGGKKLSKTQELTKEMYEYIVSYMRGDENATFERGIEFGENLEKIMEEGDVVIGEEFYAAPTAYEETGASFALTYDDLIVHIDMVDGSVSIEPLGLDMDEMSMNINDVCLNLYYTVENFSQGVSVEVVPADARFLYENYDSVESLTQVEKPINIREYAETNDVYFDFENGYSIKWNKDLDDAIIEETDEAMVEDYAGREHK